jgi:hypothetical protein
MSFLSWMGGVGSQRGVPTAWFDVAGGGGIAGPARAPVAATVELRQPFERWSGIAARDIHRSLHDLSDAELLLLAEHLDSERSGWPASESAHDGVRPATPADGGLQVQVRSAQLKDLGDWIDALRASGGRERLPEHERRWQLRVGQREVAQAFDAYAAARAQAGENGTAASVEKLGAVLDQRILAVEQAAVERVCDAAEMAFLNCWNAHTERYGSAEKASDETIRISWRLLSVIRLAHRLLDCYPAPSAPVARGQPFEPLRAFRGNLEDMVRECAVRHSLADRMGELHALRGQAAAAAMDGPLLWMPGNHVHHGYANQALQACAQLQRAVTCYGSAEAVLYPAWSPFQSPLLSDLALRGPLRDGGGAAEEAVRIVRHAFDQVDAFLQHGDDAMAQAGQTIAATYESMRRPPEQGEQQTSTPLREAFMNFAGLLPSRPDYSMSLEDAAPWHEVAELANGVKDWSPFRIHDDADKRRADRVEAILHPEAEDLLWALRGPGGIELVDREAHWPVIQRYGGTQ